MSETFKMFADYGIEGLVIFALFLTLYYGLKQINVLVMIHKEEREQWLSAYKENTEVLRTLSAKCSK